MMKLNSFEESGPVEYIVIFFQVFPEALHYDRLTGTFTTVDSADKVAQNGMEGTSSPLYGATDEEREQLLQWAQRERLPLFLKWVVQFIPCSVLILASDWLTTVKYGAVSHVWRHQREI